jgi:hypothetical protein
VGVRAGKNHGGHQNKLSAFVFIDAVIPKKLKFMTFFRVVIALAPVARPHFFRPGCSWFQSA